MLVSTALVLIMTPGLAFFYAGMVGRKNVVSTLYQSVIALAVIGVVWAVAGYTIAFSTGTPFVGDRSYALLAGVSQEANDGSTIPHILFMMFQMMFAIITPALITGAFAERVRFSSWLLVMVLWSLIVYSPVAHWLWTPGGYLAGLGGLIGTIMTGLLASTAINSAGADGLLNGGDKLFTANLTAAVMVAGYSMLMTLIILKVVMCMRAS